MLGRYRLLSLLATGGMGEVFLARQEGPAGFAKTVVVKRILRHLAQDQGFIDQFVNEARLAALLQHPNIAQVFGLEHEGNTWFMAMEYVHGRSLRNVIEECKKKGLKVPVRVAVRLCSQVLQGLHSAHELTDANGSLLGILHRDVTPENILVSFNGQTKLVDFGIAKAMSNATLRQRPPWGKLPYMAPELIRQMPPADRRADLYALSVVMHELITLVKPPNVQSSVETLSVPTTPYAPYGALPRGLDDLLVKALALEPNDRWSNAAEMSEALEGWLAATGQTVGPNDVRAFLIDLFGARAAERHDSGASAHVGTQPLVLGTAPLSPGVGLGRALALGDENDDHPTILVPQQQEPSQLRFVVGLGLATLLVFLTVVSIGVFGSRKSQTVTPTDAPLVATDPPVEPAALDAGPEQAQVTPIDTPSDEPVEVMDAGTFDVDFDELLDPVTKIAKPPRKRGKVVFRLNPGVEVFLGNRSLGTTPLKPLSVPAGSATFTLKAGKNTRRVSVKVPINGSVQLKAELKK